MIKKVNSGYKVLSKKGKNLGGPYKSKAAAQKLVDSEILDVSAVGEIDDFAVLPQQAKQLFGEVKLIDKVPEQRFFQGPRHFRWIDQPVAETDIEYRKRRH